MGVLKAKVGGSWIEIPGVGAPSMPSIFYATAAGGTITTAQGSTAVASLTTPAIAGRAKLLTAFSLKVSQPTSGAFDIQFGSPGNDLVTQQFGAGVNAQGSVAAWTRPWIADGTAMLFRIFINAWGGQSVVVSNVSNIMVMVFP